MESKLELWLDESLYNHGGNTPDYLKHKKTSERFSQIVKLYEPFRDQIEKLISYHDGNPKTWPTYRRSIWVSVPDDPQTRTERLMKKWAKEDKR